MDTIKDSNIQRIPHDEANDEISLGELAGIVSKYRGTVFGFFLLSVGAALAYILVATPIYRSDLLIHLDDSSTKLSILADLQLDGGSGSITGRSAEEILKSRSILNKVVEELNLIVRVRPRYFPLIGPRIARRHQSKAPADPLFGPESYAWGGESLRIGHLTVPENYAKTEFTVRASGEDGFVLEDGQGTFLASGRVGQRTVQNGFSIEVRGLVARPGTLFDLSMVTNREASEAIRENLRVSGGGRLGKGDILKLEYEHENPEIAAAVLNRIAHHYVNYNIQRKTEEAEKTLSYIETQLKSFAKDVTFDNNLYLLLMSKAQELRVLKAGVAAGIHILDPAIIPNTPSHPTSGLTLGLSAILGLFGGIFSAFLRRALDHTVRDPDELESKSGIEVFGIIPKSKTEQKLTSSSRFSVPQLLSEHASDDLAVEGFRYLRTAFHFHMRGHEKGFVVAICGTTANVGKTFVATNLSYLLTESGKNIVLLDADMHRGRAYEYFAPLRSLGLSDYLTGKAEVDEIVQKSRVPGLSVIPPGALVANSSTAIENGRLQLLLGKLRERFDIVMIDTPPLLAVSDSITIGRESDAMLLVARAGKTMFSDITESLRRLLHGGVHPAGVILNDMAFSSRGYGHAYGGYAYVPEYLAAKARNKG